MRNLRLPVAVLLAATLLAGCGPFIDVVKLDAAERPKLRERLRYYEGSGPPSHQVVQPIRATSCKQKLWDPPASQEDAIDQLRFKAAALGANGISNLTCDSPEGMSVSKNCWSGFTCRADAIKVTP